MCCIAPDCYNRNSDEVQHFSSPCKLCIRPKAADYTGNSQRGRTWRRTRRRRVWRAAHVDAGRQDFIFRQGRSLMRYDPATKTSKLLIDTTPIDDAAVNVPADEGPTDWTNRRARAGGMQVSGDGKVLLYSAGGDLFLIHIDTGEMGATHQDAGRRNWMPSCRPMPAWSRSAAAGICTRWTWLPARRRGSRATARIRCATEFPTGCIRKS